IEMFELRHVIVAYGRHGDAEVADALRRCSAIGIEVHAVPRLYELGLPSGVGGSDVWGLPIGRVDVDRTRGRAWRCKRLFDIVASFVLIVITAPILAALAAAVKLSSKGPVLFRQRRVGRDGQQFDVLKFRSMRTNDESDVQW